MAKIPYFFETPVPKWFRDHGFLKNPNMCAFLMFCFSRCNTEKHLLYHIQKAIELEPFEFIFGRRICSLETGLTENEVRSCIHQLNDTPIGQILKKTTSKTTNKFTVYKWSTEVFCKSDPQQKHQQTTSRPPADHHNERNEELRRIDIKDDSLEAVEIVHNSNWQLQSDSSFLQLKKQSAPSPSAPALSSCMRDEVDESMNFVHNFVFHNGKLIKEKTVLQWFKKYPLEEILSALRFYEKAYKSAKRKKETIDNPEGFVQSALDNRYWEKDQLREAAKQRERKAENEKLKFK
jgi:hypothetical protein